MPQTIHITPQKGYLLAEVSGIFNENNAHEFILQMIKSTYEYSTFKILVDIRYIKGPISTFSRFSLAEFLSDQRTSPRIQMAVIESPDQMKNPRFFENVAVNRGALVKIFTTSTNEALEWLEI